RRTMKTERRTMKSALFIVYRSSFIVALVHRSAQKRTSVGFPGGGSQPLTAALCPLRPTYSLRHSLLLTSAQAPLPERFEQDHAAGHRHVERLGAPLHRNADLPGRARARLVAQ